MKIIARIICFFKGHSWHTERKYYPYPYLGCDDETYCTRCDLDFDKWLDE